MDIFTENIDLKVTIHAEIGFPGILSDPVDLPQMDLGFTFKTNLAGITRILGADVKRPEVVMRLRTINCLETVIPSRLSLKDGMDHDLWLFILTVRFA